MSQLPQPKLTFKHDVNGGLQRVSVFDSKGNVIMEHSDKTFEGAMSGIQIILKTYVQSALSKKETVYLRGLLRPCDKKGDGRLPIPEALWEKITMNDFLMGHIGAITQAEMARIRGVSRQAINQAVNKGDIEVFLWKNEKYIPFDTVAVTPQMFDLYGEPMVTHYSPSDKQKKPRRRFKKVL